MTENNNHNEEAWERLDRATAAYRPTDHQQEWLHRQLSELENEGAPEAPQAPRPNPLLVGFGLLLLLVIVLFLLFVVWPAMRVGYGF